MKEYLGPNGALADILKDFSERESQLAMAEYVEKALHSLSPIVIEAPTGVGKTYAYLIPILANQKKAIISTATIVLQHQLFEKDIPLLEKLFGKTIKVEILKGRQNYLCVSRFFALRNGGKLEKGEREIFDILSEWINYTETGDFNEIEGISVNPFFLRKINADKNFCTGRKCPDYQRCFFYKARARCLNADLILVNHHLFVSDLALKESDFGSILPPVDVVVIDEAHRFENIASIQFGENFSLRMLAIFFNQLPSDLRLKYVKDFDFLLEPKNLGEIKNLSGKLTDLQKRYFSRLNEVLDGIFKDLSAVSPEEFELRDNLLKRCSSFKRFIELSEHSDYVSFYEKEGNSVVFKVIPIEISDRLRNLFKSFYPCAVFTSATLSVNKNLSFFKSRLGIEDAEDKILPPIFNYSDNTMLYVPRNIPEVNEQGFVEAAFGEVLKVARLLRGRIFVLCTSLQNVKAFARLFENLNEFKVFVQGQAPNSHLLEEFRENDNSVLIGSLSFWEGVDIKGDDLLCVAIDRLPFNRPDDPVFEKRCSRMENCFKNYAVPLAILQLKQGMGRLIRDKNDKGLFIILDKRIKTKWYGRMFVNSLFKNEITSDFGQVEEFVYKKLINSR